MARDIQGDRSYDLIPEGPLYHARKRGLDAKKLALAAAFALGLSIPLGLAAYNRQTDQEPPIPPPTPVEPESSSVQRISTAGSIPLGLIASHFSPDAELGQKIDDYYQRHGILSRLYACFPDDGGPVTGTVIDDLPIRNLPNTKDPAAGTLPRGTRISFNLVVRTLKDRRVDNTPNNSIPLNEWMVLPDGDRSVVFAAAFYGEPKVDIDQLYTCAPVISEAVQPK